MLAASRDRSDLLNLLLAAGAEIDTQRPNGYTALMLAAAAGLTAALQTLLKRGADVTKKTRGGKTALNLAEGKARQTLNRPAFVQENYERVVQLLRNAVP